MRIVAYIRVSTEKQTAQGASPENQRRNALGHAASGRYEIVEVYEESASAGSVTKRRIFQRMLDELNVTKPACIVVDSADRFSRNLEDVFAVIRDLRTRGINIWPLDWDRAEPPEIITYDSEDYLRFRGEIIAAQAELRRIQKRVARSYAGRRERGATTTNNAPYGLRKDGDRLVPDTQNPHRIEIIAEVDRRLLAGESVRDINRWIRTQDDDAPASLSVIARWMDTRVYLEVGLRSRDTQERLDALREIKRKRYGFFTKFEHEFTGVFACAVCVARGRNPENALMAGGGKATGRNPRLRCPNFRDSIKRPALHASTFSVSEARIRPLWMPFIEALVAADVDVDAYAGSYEPDVAARRLGLERQLSRLEIEETRLAMKADKAIWLVGDRDKALDRRGRDLLRAIDVDLLALGLQRTKIVNEINAITGTLPDAKGLRELIAAFATGYARASIRDRNLLNRMLCAIIGHPLFSRSGPSRWDDPVIEWPGLRALLDAGAPRKGEPVQLRL